MDVIAPTGLACWHATRTLENLEGYGQSGNRWHFGRFAALSVSPMRSLFRASRRMDHARDSLARLFDCGCGKREGAGTRIGRLN